MDPRTVRPRQDWALVLTEPRKMILSSGLVMPGQETGAEKVTETAGEVIRLGHHAKLVEKLGLKEGDRVLYRAFLKHHMPIPNEEKWEDGSAKHYFLLDCADILAVLPKGVDVGVYSRPSQSAVESVDEEGKVRMRR